MKSRYVFKVKEPITTEALYSIMKNHWNTKRFNSFLFGMPEPNAKEEFIILPGTYQHIVIIYAEKNKIVMGSYWAKTNLAKQLAEKTTYTSEFYEFVEESKTLPAGRDRMGPLKSILARYSAEMLRMLSELSM
jgi:hypothetical protein